jgi:polygalacturonase
VKQNRWVLVGIATALTVLVVATGNLAGCSSNKVESALPAPVCGSTVLTADAVQTCGAGDTTLPAEPTLPTDDQTCVTLASTHNFPDETAVDTSVVQAALSSAACKGKAVRLVPSADGKNTVFVTGSLAVNGTTLWVDQGVTLYASRNPKYYQSDGNCGLTGVSDSNACLPLLQITGTSPGLMGDGVIDGQGGEPIYQQAYSWWDLSNALRTSNGSAPNPALVEVKKATGFVMYRITLHNSPKFHIKLQSVSPSPTLDDAGFPSCTAPGAGFIVWGITILTPSVLETSTGFRPNPYYSRNTDGIDPGEFGQTNCGVIACSTVSTGDDMVALKAAHGLKDIVIAYNHFGTGHGMSLGSETNGGATNVDVHNLTIDGDSRWTGAPASDTGDFNGIRVKSDESRGGLVDNINFKDVCIRDVLNPIVIDSSYNPLYGYTPLADGGVPATIPIFKRISLTNVRNVMCMNLAPGLVVMQGYSGMYAAGPITLDNVVVDGITPLDVYAQGATIVLGPGNVNFIPVASSTVTVTNSITADPAPMPCTFPPLPVPR